MNDQDITTDAGPCKPCEEFAGASEPEACLRDIGYLTKEEEEILSLLRELKARARSLSARIDSLRKAVGMGKEAEFNRINDQPVLKELTESISELKVLKDQWYYWASQRERATARKLALLGHGPWLDNIK